MRKNMGKKMNKGVRTENSVQAYACVCVCRCTCCTTVIGSSVSATVSGDMQTRMDTGFATSEAN